MSKREKLASSLLSSGLVTGTVVATLIVADAPTWGWIGFGWLTWLICKTQDWVKASR